jgi:phosphate transport system substrate-binding protein
VLLSLVVLLLVGIGAYYVMRGHSAPVNSVASADRQTPPLLRLSGSNTIGAQLGPDLAVAWLTGRGASNVHVDVPATDETRVTATLGGSVVAVAVKAHGSATAFSDLGSNSCDIGMASRKIKSDEAAALQSKGFGDLTSNSAERVLGLDGVAIVVNESNNADSLTRDEVATIFSSGKSPGRTWNVYARDDKSGTYDTFKDRVLGSRVLVSAARRFEDSRALVRAVSEDRNGIGFVGLPYAVGVKVLAIEEKGTRPLIPNTMTVRTEAYSLSRRLYLYVPDNAKPEARDFVRFALSPQGQDFVEKDGFIGQKVEVLKSEQASANAPAEYLRLLPSSDRLSVDFRFRTGSSELDTKAVDDIKRVASAFSTQFAGRAMVLVGFADSTGNPGANIKLSKDRADAVSEQMKRQGITPALVTGLGQELPVADNGTPEGREKNRRVEVWLKR